MAPQPVLIAGSWRPATASGTFQAVNTATGETLPDLYPVSTWADCDAALTAATSAAAQLATLPSATIAAFLENYAGRIDAAVLELATLANSETGLPVEPRLAKAELPRTTNQLRQAAAAARDGSWRRCTIDSAANIRSYLAPIGPVVVFGPNNFPLAFNSISGGDFAAALAAGNPVIGKGHSAHPGTTRRLAELAHEAATETGLPPGTIQLIYRTNHADGERLVSDLRTGASAYTGSRSGGLKLKTAADAVGKPIYLELSSINPVVMLPGALAERGDALVDEYAGSVLMGCGQFCTNPGLLLMLAGPATETFIAATVQRFTKAAVGPLLGESVLKSLHSAVETLEDAGAELLTGGDTIQGNGFRYANTLLRASAKQFLAQVHAFQTEAFGNAGLIVVADDLPQLLTVLESLEGNLTGCVYSHTSGGDDAAYAQVAPLLRRKVGRLINDKMPTGVAVSPAMNHGGPFPATGHPGFTAVGIPAALTRFAMLQSFDNVRPGRLPAELQNKNPTGQLWRNINLHWTQGDVG